MQSGKYKSGNTIRKIYSRTHNSESTYLDNINRKIQIAKIQSGNSNRNIQIGTYKSKAFKSENTNRNNTDRIIQIGKYQSVKFGKYKLENINWTIR